MEIYMYTYMRVHSEFHQNPACVRATPPLEKLWKGRGTKRWTTSHAQGSVLEESNTNKECTD